MTEITSGDPEDYANERRSIKRKLDSGRRTSESTIRKHLICLGTLFKWTKRRGMVQGAGAASAARLAAGRDPRP